MQPGLGLSLPVPPREARDEESEARSVHRQAEGAELEVPPAEAERQRVAVPAQQAREEEAPHETNRVRLIVTEHFANAIRAAQTCAVLWSRSSSPSRQAPSGA